MALINAQALLALPHDEMVDQILRMNVKRFADTQNWQFWQRNDQSAPQADWRVWLVMAGRGYGKTRMGAEWVSALACEHPGAWPGCSEPRWQPGSHMEAPFAVGPRLGGRR